LASTGLARRLEEGNCSSELEATRAVGSVPTRGRTFISRAAPAVPGRECILEYVLKSKMSYEKEQEPGAIG